MLTEDEISALAADLESSRVERKEAFKSVKGSVEEAICAFANDLAGTGKPGYLLIGVEDKTGLPAKSFSVTDELLRDIAGIRSDGNILPFPRMNVDKARLGGKEIVLVEVHPSPDPPVRLRGRVCVRVGPRKGTATRDEERVLSERRRAWDGPFDQRAVHGSSLDDLDLILFEREFLPGAVSPEVLRENGRSVPEQLAALHLASPDGVPNVAGMLVLGRAPTTYLPGAYVQFVKVQGTDLTDPIVDRKELTGPLSEVLRRMDEITGAHIHVATSVVGSAVEEQKPDYPLAAMQQLLRNAVMHRNYETSNAPVQWYWFSDRIEIHNPGGLFGRATRETFGKTGGNDYRNPTVAAALHNLGFVQRFGMGIPLARKACKENGNPPPEFEPGATSFGVVVRARA
ncbi:MAG: ATP-binding protein [Polyangiaceae bacterium]